MDAIAKRPSETYAEGLQARAHGVSGEANPYRAGSQEFASWARGWKSADEKSDVRQPQQAPPVEAPTG
jgi:hypothetical protein